MMAGDAADTVGNRIRHRRKELGFTLETLGERLELSAQAMQRYETGARKVSVPLLEKIAAELDCAPGRLIPGGDGLTDDERAFIDWMREHPRDRKVLESTLRGLRDSADTPFHREGES